MVHFEALEILLQGLCGVHKECLRIHELCLKSSPNLGSFMSEVLLLCDLVQPEPTWTVKHVGGAMRDAGAEQISVLVRTMEESKASKNVLHMIYTLGYKLDPELLRVGFAFHFRRGASISVTVSSINKMLKLHAIDEAVPVTLGIQLVEVTAPATSENYSEVVTAVSSFCEYLAPLLHLSKPVFQWGLFLLQQQQLHLLCQMVEAQHYSSSCDTEREILSQHNVPEMHSGEKNVSLDREFFIAFSKMLASWGRQWNFSGLAVARKERKEWKLWVSFRVSYF